MQPEDACPGRKRLTFLGLVASVAMVLVLVPSCRGEVAASPAPEPQESGSEAGLACIPGQQVACPCVGGGAGAQVCNATGSSYEACICGDAGLVDASRDAAPDARDASMWWSDAGTCNVVANRCLHGAALPDGGPDILSADGQYDACLCEGTNEPDLQECRGVNFSNVLPRCDAYCKANNPGYEASTYCSVTAGAGGPIFHCECSVP